MSNLLMKKLASFADNNLNVLLVGTHGIGKTAMVEQLAREKGLKLSYYSASTLDPWTDIVGVPKPTETEDGDTYLEFYRPKKIEDAEFLFFDELNRAHPRVLNAVLEIIQFKRINGTPLPNLKMVWAAINPPGEDYNVEALDPALVDRFHLFLNVVPEISVPYMKTKMPEGLARVLSEWWNDEVTVEQRKVITPRRIEYMGQLINLGLDFDDGLPKFSSVPMPTKNLRDRLKKWRRGEEHLSINRESIVKNVDKFTDMVRDDISIAPSLVESLIEMGPEEITSCLGLLELFPKDLINNVGGIKFIGWRRAVFKLLKDSKVDLELYPKVSEIYEFAKFEKEED